MKYVLAAALTAALTLSAQAQETTTAAPEVAASACPAFTPAPEPPNGTRLNATQANVALAAFEAWRAQTQTTLDCRSAEHRSLVAQARARQAEMEAARTANEGYAVAWQTQLDAYHARQNRR